MDEMAGTLYHGAAGTVDLAGCLDEVGDLQVFELVGEIRGLERSFDSCLGGSGKVRRDISRTLDTLEIDLATLLRYPPATDTDVASVKESFGRMREALSERRGQDIELADSASRTSFDRNLDLVERRSRNLVSRVLAECISPRRRSPPR